MNEEPKRVRLTEDFLDLKAGVGFPLGTILERQPGGQYIPKGTPLGAPCVTGFFLIREICETIDE